MPAQAERYVGSMREERTVVGEVPVKLYSPPGASAVLLLGHGGGHSKDSPRFERLARRYAAETGLAVACIDAVDHGERQPAVSGGPVPAGWHSRTVERMVEDWQATVASLEAIGPAIAYVGFSMGAIFGFSTVAVMSTVRAAVFVAGGIPRGGGIDDPALGPVVLDAASRLGHCRVLMSNMAEDEIFPAEDVRSVFDALPGPAKELVFWPGDHNDWSPELISASIAFLRQHLQMG